MLLTSLESGQQRNSNSILQMSMCFVRDKGNASKPLWDKATDMSG